MSNNTKKVKNRSIVLDSEVVRQLDQLRGKVIGFQLGAHDMKEAIEYVLRWCYYEVVESGREVDLKKAMDREVGSRHRHPTTMTFEKEFEFHLNEFGENVLKRKFGKYERSQAIRYAIWYMYEMEIERNEIQKAALSS